ncbi:hypothetical protein PIIN_05005 [Serendipita indica DSM 11827]|uniref:Uncharacterized protein n=1 Tax=Serendipita indica (strain DSM 11827) TaxID=1109443 RepID=G4TIE3_SERID|nr:hypothetical protein PIIN_05005 [Serendipita indica DSM 11827]
MSDEQDALKSQINPPADQQLALDTEPHSGRDRSTSDAWFPPNPPPSSPHSATVIPFSLPAPSFEEGDTSFSRSIDAILATQTEREVVEEKKIAAAVSKRASNVLKLTQENKDLERELKEMAERLEAIERKSQELKTRQGSPTTSKTGDTSPPPGES